MGCCCWRSWRHKYCPRCRRPRPGPQPDCTNCSPMADCRTPEVSKMRILRLSASATQILPSFVGQADSGSRSCPGRTRPGAESGTGAARELDDLLNAASPTYTSPLLSIAMSRAFSALSPSVVPPRDPPDQGAGGGELRNESPMAVSATTRVPSGPTSKPRHRPWAAGANSSTVGVGSVAACAMGAVAASTPPCTDHQR